MTGTKSTGSARLFAAGAWLLAFIGFGHLAFAHFGSMLKLPSDAEATVYGAMRQLQPMPLTEHSLWDFYQGNSLGLGLMCLAFGLVCVMFGKSFRKRGLEVPRSLVVLCATVGWFNLVAAVLYFPPPPVVILFVASSCFTAAALLGRRTELSREEVQAHG